MTSILPRGQQRDGQSNTKLQLHCKLSAEAVKTTGSRADHRWGSSCGPLQGSWHSGCRQPSLCPGPRQQRHRASTAPQNSALGGQPARTQSQSSLPATSFKIQQQAQIHAWPGLAWSKCKTKAVCPILPRTSQGMRLCEDALEF